jgi:DNA-binding MarR family transcriptional regulator
MTKIKASKRASPFAPQGGLTPDAQRGANLSAAMINFHEAVARKLGVTAAEWKTLSVLRRTSPATAGTLAKATGLTTGAITGIVDRLEKAGYARREDNPDDRRSVLVRPVRNQRVHDIIAPIFTSLTQAMTELAGRYTEQEKAVIGDYLERTTEVLKNETVKLKSPARRRPRRVR